MTRTSYCLALLVMALGIAPAAEAQIQVQNVVIKLIDQVDIPSREVGLLDELLLREGDRVKHGEPVAQLDADDVKLLQKQTAIALEIAQAEANNGAALREAEGELAVAQAELERAEQSRARLEDSVSDAEYQRLKLAVIQAEAKREQSQVQQKVAELTAKLKQQDLVYTALQLERRTIRSPLEGVVVQLYAKAGEWLEAGDKVARVIRLDKLRAEGFVDQANMRPDLKGSKVSLSVELPGRSPVTLPGTIVFVSPEVDTFNRQVRVWAEIDNASGHLQPGAAASMIISTKR